MRKGYGPTGVSFTYPFAKFEEEVKDGKRFRIHISAGHKGAVSLAPLLDLKDATRAHLRALYDATDNLSYVHGHRVLYTTA